VDSSMSVLCVLHVDGDGGLGRPALEALSTARQVADGLAVPLAVGLVGAVVAHAANALGSAAGRCLGVSGAEFAEPRYVTDAAALQALCRAAGADLVIVPGTARSLRVAAGVVARGLLARLGMEVFAWVSAIGGDAAAPAQGPLATLRPARDASPFYGCDAAADARWIAAVDAARKAGDTLGGVIEVRIVGAPPGLGSHVQPDRKLDARLAAACMGIQAIKGVEVGAGFTAAASRGSAVHDAIAHDPAAPWGFRRARNNAGGIEGGMSNGEEIRLRLAKKPISTLRTALKSVDLVTKAPSEAAYERSDTCAVPAASVIAEHVVAFEIAIAACEKFGGDSMTEMERNFRGYVEQVRKF